MSRQRLHKVDEAVRQAQEARADVDKELRDGEIGLEQLWVEASEQMATSPLRSRADGVPGLQQIVIGRRIVAIGT